MGTVLEEFLERLEQTNHPEEVRMSHDRLPEMFTEYLSLKKIRGVIRLITACHDAMVKKVLSCTQREMEREGKKTPDIPYCWVVMGSGGRNEQTFHTDQDYGLIYEQTSSEELEAIECYFEEFAERAVIALEQAGYPLCTGFVMPVNPRWRGELNVWCDRFEGYFDYPNWEHVRYLLIASDMRPLFGNMDLGERLRTWLIERMKNAEFVLWQVAAHEREHGVALDRFSRFRIDLSGPEKGRLNLKEGLYLQLVNILRLWSLKGGFTETESFARLEKLRESGIWPQEWGGGSRKLSRSFFFSV
ncbi:hypothetical protein DNHGIG_23100 [Collibacillus ludicampi]|uniref:Nucleotidyltransferase n=1 Tax=Collibacillus ludicampi TaxID=2771369 RepID=A0AAV4LFZ2_9BACL|nr:hypothetical protein DNHGIG_23100 [Collibacillus ludicampi]